MTRPRTRTGDDIGCAVETRHESRRHEASRREELLTPAEELVLARRKSLGDEQARRRLIEANRRLVLSITRDYASASRLSVPDLVQEGTIGLIRAVERFDPSRGHRLSTYATWWIRRSVTRAIVDQSRAIRLPVYLSERQRRVRRFERAFAERHGRAPSAAEIAAETGLTPVQVRRAQAAADEPLSLDATIGENGSSLAELLEGEQSDRPESVVTTASRDREVRRALATLDRRRRRVLELRFGLGGEHEHSLQEIGDALGVTRERARQLEKEGLGALRAAWPALANYVHDD